MTPNFWSPTFLKEFGYNQPDEWDKTNLKIIFLFPSTLKVRSISPTYQVLYNIIKDNFGGEVFVDFSTLPVDSMRSTYYRNEKGWKGFLSGREVREFDIAAISISITHLEILEVWKQLNRIEFPVDRDSRINDRDFPFLIAGGIAVDQTAALDSVVDMVLWGLGERAIPRLISEAIKIQSRDGGVKARKLELITALKDYEGFYYPGAYQYESYVESGKVHHDYVGRDIAFPRIVYPDSGIDINEFGHYYDHRRAFPTSFSQSKSGVLLSLGCTGVGQCSFCHAGNQIGVWRERGVDDLTKALQISKRSSMAESFSYYSFNSNYYSDYQRAVELASEYFHRVIPLNFRADQIAHNPEILDLLQELGAFSVSIAPEGFGDRVRDRVLNKNLSREEFLSAAKAIVKRRFLRMKLGYIWTGFEKKKDFREGFQEIQDIIDYRDSLYSQSSIQINISKLVNIVHTPMYSKPRVMAYDEYLSLSDDNYFNYPFTSFTKMGVRVKITPIQGQTFIHQLLVDLGRFARTVLLETITKKNKGWGRDYFQAVKEKSEELGISFYSQFLDPDYRNDWAQHMKVRTEDLWDGKTSMAPCTATLKSRDKCVGCGQCDGEVSKRQVAPVGSAESVKSIRMKYSPRFRYLFRGCITERGRYVPKEAVIRRLFSIMSEHDCGAVEGGDDFYRLFRRMDYFSSRNVDYTDYPSVHNGEEIFTILMSGMKDFSKSYIDYVNGRMEGFELWSIERCGIRDDFSKLYSLFRVYTELSTDKVGEAFDHFRDERTVLVSSGARGGGSLKAQVSLYLSDHVKTGEGYFDVMTIPIWNPLFLLNYKISPAQIFVSSKMEVLGFYELCGGEFKEAFSSHFILDKEFEYIGN